MAVSHLLLPARVSYLPPQCVISHLSFPSSLQNDKNMFICTPSKARVSPRSLNPSDWPISLTVESSSVASGLLNGNLVELRSSSLSSSNEFLPLLVKAQDFQVTAPPRSRSDEASSTRFRFSNIAGVSKEPDTSQHSDIPVVGTMHLSYLGAKNVFFR